MPPTKIQIVASPHPPQCGKTYLLNRPTPQGWSFPMHRPRWLSACLTLLFTGILYIPATAQDNNPKPTSLDRDLAGNDYRPFEPVTGDLKVVGSRSMVTLLDQWAEGLRKHHPKLTIDLDCDGSETAVTELAKGKSVVGALSRILSANERKQIEEKTGLELLALPVCHWEMVLVAHPSTPVSAVRLSRVRDAFFSMSKDSTAPTWGDLGAANDWQKKPVLLLTRENASGTRAALRQSLGAQKEHAERQGEEMPSFRELVQAAATRPGALGYCSRRIAATGEVKVLSLVDDYANPLPPLIQTMTLVVGREKGKSLDPAVLEFLAFALSASGQAAVTRDNFRPLEIAEVHAGFDRAGFSSVK